MGLLNLQLEQMLSDGGQLKEGKNVCMITSEIWEEILLIMLHYHQNSMHDQLRDLGRNIVG